MTINFINFVARICSGISRRMRKYYFSIRLKNLGRGCQISSGVIMKDPHNIEIGNNVYLNDCVLLQSCEGALIKIEDNVVLSFGAMVLTGGLDLSSGYVSSKHTSSPVIIMDSAWIGAKSIILPGVTIGKGSVIAAGSTVIADVAEGSVVAGSPAKTIRMLGEIKDKGGKQ